jgi:hypothetical protein
MITVQKAHKNISRSFNHHDNVVRIRANRWRYCEFCVLLALTVGCQVVRLSEVVNITYNFLYCNHQVHKDFMIILYIRHFEADSTLLHEITTVL